MNHSMPGNYYNNKRSVCFQAAFHLSCADSSQPSSINPEPKGRWRLDFCYWNENKGTCLVDDPWARAKIRGITFNFKGTLVHSKVETLLVTEHSSSFRKMRSHPWTTAKRAQARWGSCHHGVEALLLSCIQRQQRNDEPRYTDWYSAVVE